MPGPTQGAGGALVPSLVTEKQEAIAIATVGSVFKTNLMIHLDRESFPFHRQLEFYSNLYISIIVS